MPVLEYVEITPKVEPVATVIWMHGLGADGNDFVPVVPHLGVDDIPIKFIFPHAPMRNVTVNGGMPMRAWFDVYAMGAKRDINHQDLLEVSESVADLIEAEQQQGIPADKIILIGFSQGGAVGYQTALRYSKKLAGLAALSTYRIASDDERSQPLAPNMSLAILVNHGDSDAVVPTVLGKEGYDSLIQQGLKADWVTYPMDHEVCLPQIQHLGQWIRKVLM